jgi:hypothetical protein
MLLRFSFSDAIRGHDVGRLERIPANGTAVSTLFLYRFFIEELEVMFIVSSWLSNH